MLPFKAAIMRAVLFSSVTTFIFAPFAMSILTIFSNPVNKWMSLQNLNFNTLRIFEKLIFTFIGSQRQSSIAIIPHNLDIGTILNEQFRDFFKPQQTDSTITFMFFDITVFRWVFNDFIIPKDTARVNAVLLKPLMIFTSAPFSTSNLTIRSCPVSIKESFLI